MAAKRSNPDFLNGVPELLLLQLLAGKAMHGYDLVQAIRAATGEKLEFGEGCIYSVLHKLESAGLLSSRRELVAGRSRVVYRLSAKGRKKLAGSRDAWLRVVAAVSGVLKGGRDGTPAMD